MTQREQLDAVISRVEAGTLTAAEAITLLGRLGSEGRVVLDAMALMGFGAVGFRRLPARP